MPADRDTDMAFVLVQHLAPDHKSILTDLIRHYTRMQVFEVEDGMEVKANSVYIIPPNRDMAFFHGALHLLAVESSCKQRMPIDFFFRSLAQDQGEHAICIVLSGTGSDGTLGVRAIKGAGGMAMAQSPDSTEYDSMPFSAIDTGLVDYVTQPAKMPAQLMAYVAHAFGKLPRLPAIPPIKAENDLQKIFILLRAQTGHDFSQYKPRTIHRRIERRMAVHQIESIDGYVKYAQQTPTEVEALFRDLMIGVTSFFRDTDAFAELEKKVIPALLANKPTGALIRVWVPGCSTGEEAYSIAILLFECMEKMHRSYNFQIFATDIDSRSISSARTGYYSANISTDMSAERLSRYFIPEPEGCGYRIIKVIRDMLVFSEQNVIKDPPFSKLDFISCRNLLIYMNGELQKKIIPLFHFALNPDGYLFLGTSETIGEFDDLFAVKDRKQKIYQRKEVAHLAGMNKFHPPRLSAMESPVPHIARQTFFTTKLPLRELAEHALLQQLVESAALVNSNGDGLYFHGRTGLYLEPAPGEATVNILKMAREGLRRDLTMALHKAVSSREIVICQGLKVKTNGDYTSVNLIVRPVESGPSGKLEAPLYLVILGQTQPCMTEAIVSAASQEDKKEGNDPTLGSEARISALQQ
jgi:two-component system CheB/CheR fusion protein